MSSVGFASTSSLGAQTAQSRSCLYAVDLNVGTAYVHGALGLSVEFEQDF